MLAVDDQGVVTASAAAATLGFRHNPPDAAAATRDKAIMRERLAAASLPQPAFRAVSPGADIASAATAIGYPCVVKPVSRSASQGVIRVNDAIQAEAAAVRIGAMMVSCPEPLLVERFVPGEEVAVEGLLRGAVWRCWRCSTSPIPWTAPFSRRRSTSRRPASRPAILAHIETTTGQAATALALREGPLHAELRIGPDGGRNHS